MGSLLPVLINRLMRVIALTRPFSAEGYSEMSTENQMSSEIPAYSEIIQAPVLIYNIFSSQNPQFPYMKKPNPPMVGLEYSDC
eukprot:COSAG01_NODE_29492_length_636_cov_1.033520_1_plen_83_part_00